MDRGIPTPYTFWRGGVTRGKGKRRRNEQVNGYIEVASQGRWQDCRVGITAREKEEAPRTMVTEVAGELPGVRVFVVHSEERLAYERAMREAAGLLMILLV
jgi:hypothetical protein